MIGLPKVDKVYDKIADKYEVEVKGKVIQNNFGCYIFKFEYRLTNPEDYQDPTIYEQEQKQRLIHHVKKGKSWTKNQFPINGLGKSKLERKIRKTLNVMFD